MIATEEGWNLYVGGNGGFTPRHAELFAEDLSTEELVRTIDRFLMYYIRTADRLQRTAAWVEDSRAGSRPSRDVIVEDSLGIGADLDAAMAGHVDSYVDEWAATLADPEKRAQFVSFVNAPETPDPDMGACRSGQPSATSGCHRDRRADAGGTTMTLTDDCRGRPRRDRVDPRLLARPADPRARHRGPGRAAPVALFLLDDGTVHAVGHRDPFSDANVMARGIIGSVGAGRAIATPSPRRCTSRSSTSPPASA